MKKALSLLTTIALLTCAFASAAIAQSSVPVTAFVEPTGKLHLRAEPSTSSASLGLFYPGVVVTCLSDISNPNTAWIRVRIGAQIGYMMRDYLIVGLPNNISIESAQPTAWVKTGSHGNSMNLYTAPIDRTAAAGSVKDGDFVTVLGETADHWYYVRTDNGVFGYAKTQYFSTSAPSTVLSVAVAAVVNNPNPSDRLNLRANPSTYAASLGRYYNGTPVTIIEYTNGTWAKVRIGAGQGSIEGYVMRQYLSTDGHYTAIAIPTYYVNTSSLVMRSSRSTSSASMGSYKRGTAVEILGYGTTWHHVRVGRKVGFMYASYLTSSFLDWIANSSPNTVSGYVRVNASTPADWTDYVTVMRLPWVMGIRFEPDARYPVYTGPGLQYPRAGGGNASVSTNSNIDVYGVVANRFNEFMLIEYKIDSNNYRFGFITDFTVASEDTRRIPIIDMNIGNKRIDGRINPINITDDPLHSKRVIDTISTYMEIGASAYLDNNWILISYYGGIDSNGQYTTKWGFVPASSYR